MDNSFGLTNHLMPVTSQTIIFMDMVNIDGLTVVNTLVIGSAIKCTALVSSLGLMEENMKVNISMIKNKGMVYLLGQMVGNMMAIG